MFDKFQNIYRMKGSENFKSFKIIHMVKVSGKNAKLRIRQKNQYDKPNNLKSYDRMRYCGGILNY